MQQKTQKKCQKEEEQEAEKNAEKSLADAVDSFVDLSDKMALDPDIEKYIGHNQFKKAEGKGVKEGESVK